MLRSRVPLVVIETRDEKQAKALVRQIAREDATPVFLWAVTRGLYRVDVDPVGVGYPPSPGSPSHGLPATSGATYAPGHPPSSTPAGAVGGPRATTAEPIQALAGVLDGIPGIYVLLDFHPYLDEPVNVRMLKDICQGYESRPRTVVLISHRVEVPSELEHLTARFSLAFPSRAERRAIVEDVAREWSAAHGRLVHADDNSVSMLVENLAGLSVADTRRLARTAIFDDGAITPDDTPAVMKAKYDLLNKGGVLSFEYETAAAADLAGMDRLKEWLARRKPAFDGSAPGLEPPKGVLLLGVQGCGKSLAARVAAGVFAVPLLRLDIAGVHDKYIGESERRLRESLATADVMAPCVVWIDEIEKGLATSDSDSGSSQRVLGTFLTWLAERRGPVFVVATANDVSRLPPELIRKGRFDEIFFVDLPDAAARAHVFDIHARRRDIALGPDDLAALSAVTDGFSGAEIEQVVVSAVYAAHDDGGSVRLEHLLAEARATRPLSVVMAERIEGLRRWSVGRTVPVG